MKTILLMQGPVCTHRAVHQNGPKFIRGIVKTQFLNACAKLEAENLGELRTVNIASRTYKVFVKKRPDLIGWFFNANPDFATLEDYREIYEMPPPGCIVIRLLDRLYELGIIQAQY